MKRLLLVFIIALIFVGCKTPIRINNSDDPQELDPITLTLGEDRYFKEKEIESPEEVQEDDWDIENVDIFAEVWGEGFAADITADLYIATESGDRNLSDPAKNQLIFHAVLPVGGDPLHIEVRNPSLARKALKGDVFYFKGVVTTAAPSTGTVHIGKMYLDILLERDTEGLFSIFYLF